MAVVEDLPQFKKFMSVLIRSFCGYVNSITLKTFQQYIGKLEKTFDKIRAKRKDFHRLVTSTSKRNNASSH